jgi:hypothetical protein
MMGCNRISTVPHWTFLLDFLLACIVELSRSSSTLEASAVADVAVVVDAAVGEVAVVVAHSPQADGASIPRLLTVLPLLLLSQPPPPPQQLASSEGALLLLRSLLLGSAGLEEAVLLE